MSGSHLAGNRNSTPEASNSLRPPSARTVANHHLRASADMGAYSGSPLSNRAIRPASEVYYNQQGQSQGNGDDSDAAKWIADIEQSENTLEEMAAATLDQDFKDELSAIEQWFRVLSEAERTAALYALLQQTTQVQIRFFIQVLQQMAKSHPMSGVLSPANFGEKDPMSQKLTDAMNKLNTEGSRNSVGFGRPPPSPGGKRTSGLDANTINSMFPDAAAAIAKQRDEFTRQTGTAPPSNRNSTVVGDRSSLVGDRSSLVAPTISAPDQPGKDSKSQRPSSPWGPSAQDAQRPKSSHGQGPMGQFTATHPPPSAGLRSPRPMQISADANLQNTTLTAPTSNQGGAGMLSPYGAGGGNWASMVNTPMVSNFNPQQTSNQADMIANATAMKLAALSTVNNRIQLDDVRKYRRPRSTDGQTSQNPQSPGLPGQNLPGNMFVSGDMGQVLTQQQIAALQAQQIAAMNGRRSRPASPGIAISGVPSTSGAPGINFSSPQNNGYLAAYDGNSAMLTNQLQNLNLQQFGLQLPGQQGGLGQGSGHHEGYLSDHSEIARGRSPRGRRGSSKPPEDPTNPELLKDIPQWLRSLRLHKYTDNLKDLKWQDLVELDDAGLEARGVAAVGARRKMLKVFEQVREAKGEGKL